jgi:copper chaperone
LDLGNGEESRVKDERKELIMQVAGMTCDGCVEAVTKAVQALDPVAEVEVDLAHSRATIRTYAQSLEITEALNRAGYEATGMTL